MSNISRVSLDDTLHLIQLVRETALANGRSAQANRLTPVMEEMRGLAKTAQTTQAAKPAAVKSAAAPTAAPAAGILGQADFKKLLEVSNSGQPAKADATEATRLVKSAAVPNPLAPVLERNRMMSAMSAAKMSDVEIARQFGVSRDEVRLVLNVQSKSKPTGEVML